MEPASVFNAEHATNAGLSPEDYFLHHVHGTPLVVLTAQGIETLRIKLGRPAITYKVERAKPYYSVVMATARVRDGKSIKSYEALGSSNTGISSVEAAQEYARARVVLAAAELMLLNGYRVVTYLDKFALSAPTQAATPQAQANEGDILGLLSMTGRQPDANRFRHYEKAVDGAVAAPEPVAAEESVEDLRAEAEERGIELSGQAEAPDGVADVAEPVGKPEAAPAEPVSTNQAASTTAAVSGEKPHPLANLTDDELRDSIRDTLQHKMIFAKERRAVLPKIDLMPREGKGSLFSAIDFYGQVIEDRLRHGQNQ